MNQNPAASAVLAGRVLARLSALLTLTATLTGTLAPTTPAAAAISTFEELSPAIPYSGFGGGFYENGSSGSGGAEGTFDGSFVSGAATFVNSYTNAGTFEVWTGFAYSDTTDSVTPGFGNQYSAFPGGGADGSATYALGFGDGATILLPLGSVPVSLSLTNTTYAALSMRDGDPFAKKFGGPTGTDPDFFSVTLTGFVGGIMTGSMEFFLADYRSANPAEDYIVSDWEPVDLTPLGPADEIRFAFASSDTSFGFINTPTYFALDNLQFAIVPEPTSVGMLAAMGGWALFGRRRR
ncbi:hypothetical protein BH23VER1_BH23VER1_22490 [soil metagenome]